MSAPRRPRLPAGQLAAAIALASLLAAGGPPAHAAGSRISLGRFAGYVAQKERLSSVSATFTVPRIRHGSPPGSLAATWIGAQARGLDVNDVPFIQIGVTELHLRKRLAGAPRNAYYAFWSDTRLHFHPQPLFPVHPGDYIAASLRRRHDGWKLAIVDADTRISARFFTRDETRGSYELAEWLQEDVTDTSTRAAEPYPRLSGGLFRQLRLDSLTPSRQMLQSEWISIPQGEVAPTAPSANSFTFHAATLGAAARRYVAAAAPLEAAARAYFLATPRWTAQTPRSVIAAASSRFARALCANIAALAGHRWRRALRPSLRLLLAHLHSLLLLVDSAAATARAAPAAWRARLDRADAACERAGRLLLRHLHGPRRFPPAA